MKFLVREIERASAEILERGRRVGSRTGEIREIVGMELGFDLEEVLSDYDPIKHSEFVKLMNAIELPIEALKKDLHTRRAVVHLSDVNGCEETECLNVVQFLVRCGYLHVVVFARSLDVGRKLFDDVMAVARVAVRVMEALKVRPGSIRFYAGSAHVHV